MPTHKMLSRKGEMGREVPVAKGAEEKYMLGGINCEVRYNFDSA